MNHHLFTACTLALSAPVIAQDTNFETEQAAVHTPLEMRAEQVVAIVNGELPPEEVFTQGFLAAVPPSQLAAISAQLTGQFGAALSVEGLGAPDGTRSSLAIRMERAIARGGIAVDPADDHKISELLFQTFEPIDDNPAKIVADLDALPGEIAYAFGPLDGGPAILSADADRAMPLGSTFKLYVLAALAREIADGRRSWGDTVTLDQPRSFPSGMMQDWPDGAPVTLHTLASLMISISDNTATDMLIRELGRDTVFRTLIDSGHSNPELNDPFLTTREMFLLKGGPDERILAYRDADASSRLQMLRQIEDTPLAPGTVEAAFSGGPIATDIEWFASADDLASLFNFMRKNVDPAAFDIMAINPSIPPHARQQWTYAGYKGGSEPGVLNLTWLLTDGAGRDHVVFLSWSNADANLDNSALELIAQRILSMPR